MRMDSELQKFFVRIFPYESKKGAVRRARRSFFIIGMFSC